MNVFNLGAIKENFLTNATESGYIKVEHFYRESVRK